MYSIEERERIREMLVANAREISASAERRSLVRRHWAQTTVGPTSIWHWNRRRGALARCATDWTNVMYRDQGALHHVDVAFGAAIYRVFLLMNTLQVDLAFFPAAEFGATHPTFRLLFGTGVERDHVPPPTAARLIGLGWLHALHARSWISSAGGFGRGSTWSAGFATTP